MSDLPSWGRAAPGPALGQSCAWSSFTHAPWVHVLGCTLWPPQAAPCLRVPLAAAPQGEGGHPEVEDPGKVPEPSRTLWGTQDQLSLHLGQGEGWPWTAGCFLFQRLRGKSCLSASPAVLCLGTEEKTVLLCPGSLSNPSAVTLPTWQLPQPGVVITDHLNLFIGI